MTRLLTTTALLALLAGGAHAEAPAARGLPAAMLGGWCATAHTVVDGEGWWISTYHRSTRRACAGDWMRLRARSYVEQVGQDVSCRFVAINQIDQVRYAVTAVCQGNPGTEQMEFSQAGNMLTGSIKTTGR